ncbi:MAG: VWA domain-containing protein [Candidatus Woesearchaeota archaeon]
MPLVINEDIMKELEGDYKYENKELLFKCWGKVLKGFNQPLLYNLPEVHPSLPDPDTAHFDFAGHYTRISKKFLDDLVENGEISLKDAITAILQHEVGHYVECPREAAHILEYGHLAEAVFKEDWNVIYNYYVDVRDNLPQMLNKKKGRELRELYKAMNRCTKKKIEMVNKNPELKMFKGDIEKASAVDRLLTSYYQDQAEEDFGVKLEKSLEKRMEKLKAIDFIDPKDEWVNLLHFGNAIKDLLVKKKGKGGGKGKGGHGDGQGEAEGPGMGSITLDDFSKGQIDDALNDIIQKYGKGRYDKIKEFVEGQTGQSFDEKRSKSSGKMVGLGKVDGIERNDDMIPYYDRLSRSSGIYIIRKPVLVNTFDPYPNENVEFSPGDPLNRLNKFSSGGRVLPGITKRFKEGYGVKKDRQFKVPDCIICLDTSGSMTHPKEKSIAVQSGFSLAKNYFANESKVGVLNFSCDSFLLPPTRDLDQVFMALCSYWGGGTVFDTEKFKKYLEQYMKMEEKGIKDFSMKDIESSTEDDYRRMLKRLSRDDQKKFEKKDKINVRVKRIEEAYEKLDTHLITDGEIWNLPEVISHFNSVASIARNVVYVIENPRQVEEWTNMGLENTQIINVEKKEDLQGFVVGRIKKIQPVRKGPRSLFQG